MSKRSEEKERLARLLDAGKISRRIYDERMARMREPSPSDAAYQARRKLRKALERGPQDWRPGAK